MKHCEELKRKSNKTPTSRYIKPNKISAIGLTNLYRNQVPVNYSGRESLNSSTKRFIEQKTIENLDIAKAANTQQPTPRLY